MSKRAWLKLAVSAFLFNIAEWLIINVHAASIGTFEATHCVRCDGLQYCTAMNGKLFFDPVYGYTRLAPCHMACVCVWLSLLSIAII